MGHAALDGGPGTASGRPSAATLPPPLAVTAMAPAPGPAATVAAMAGVPVSTHASPEATVYEAGDGAGGAFLIMIS